MRSAPPERFPPLGDKPRCRPQSVRRSVRPVTQPWWQPPFVEPITFLAALAGTNTAARWLSVDAEGSAKLALEVPASDLEAVIELRHLAGKVLRVTGVED